MDGFDPGEIGEDEEIVDDAIDDDEVSPEEQLLLDRKELHELGLELDNPEGFADECKPARSISSGFADE
jgi:hypothetical protein